MGVISGNYRHCSSAAAAAAPALAAAAAAAPALAAPALAAAAPPSLRCGSRRILQLQLVINEVHLSVAAIALAKNIR